MYISVLWYLLSGVSRKSCCLKDTYYILKIILQIAANDNALAAAWRTNPSCAAGTGAAHPDAAVKVTHIGS